MGYGPADCNRFGWCWRNDHGGGIRMTPYFKTEKLVDDFHDYFTNNFDKYKHKLSQNNPMLSIFLNNSDLRLFKLKDIIIIVDDFIKEKKLSIKKVIVKPNKETLREFYGHEMETYCSYYED